MPETSENEFVGEVKAINDEINKVSENGNGKIWLSFDDANKKFSYYTVSDAFDFISPKNADKTHTLDAKYGTYNFMRAIGYYDHLLTDGRNDVAALKMPCKYVDDLEKAIDEFFADIDKSGSKVNFRKKVAEYFVPIFGSMNVKDVKDTDGLIVKVVPLKRGDVEEELVEPISELMELVSKIASDEGAPGFYSDSLVRKKLNEIKKTCAEFRQKIDSLFDLFKRTKMALIKKYNEFKKGIRGGDEDKQLEREIETSVKSKKKEELEKTRERVTRYSYLASSNSGELKPGEDIGGVLSGLKKVSPSAVSYKIVDVGQYKGILFVDSGDLELSDNGFFKGVFRGNSLTGGTWKGGPFFGKELKDANWRNGVFRGGSYVCEKGRKTWKNGTFNGDLIQNVIIEGGTFSNCEVVDCDVRGGTFNFCRIFNSDIGEKVEIRHGGFYKNSDGKQHLFKAQIIKEEKKGDREDNDFSYFGRSKDLFIDEKQKESVLGIGDLFAAKDKNGEINLPLKRKKALYSVFYKIQQKLASEAKKDDMTSLFLINEQIKKLHLEAKDMQSLVGNGMAILDKMCQHAQEELKLMSEWQSGTKEEIRKALDEIDKKSQGWYASFNAAWKKLQNMDSPQADRFLVWLESVMQIHKKKESAGVQDAILRNGNSQIWLCRKFLVSMFRNLTTMDATGFYADQIAKDLKKSSDLDQQKSYVKRMVGGILSFDTGKFGESLKTFQSNLRSFSDAFVGRTTVDGSGQQNTFNWLFQAFHLQLFDKDAKEREFTPESFEEADRETITSTLGGVDDELREGMIGFIGVMRKIQMEMYQAYLGFSELGSFLVRAKKYLEKNNDGLKESINTIIDVTKYLMSRGKDVLDVLEKAKELRNALSYNNKETINAEVVRRVLYSLQTQLSGIIQQGETGDHEGLADAARQAQASVEEVKEEVAGELSEDQEHCKELLGKVNDILGVVMGLEKAETAAAEALKEQKAEQNAS